jgi:hypothetical protein
MTVGSMAKPLEKLKKLRSWDEIKTRGGQALSAYREQKKGAGAPTDEEFSALIDASVLGGSPVIAESLWQKFYQHGEKAFFRSLNEPHLAAKHYRQLFGDKRSDETIEAAERILDGTIDLLGFKSVNVGSDIDWHREPLSGKRSPIKHWKEFDDLDTAETGNKKILWELNRHQHFFTLGVAFILTNDERFAARFVAHLESWIEQNPPSMGVNWSSSLEVAFRSMSWIWAFHFFRDSESFTPEIFRRALKYLYLHGRHIERYLSTYYSPNTHLTGEALALYYLGTQFRFLNTSQEWRKIGENILLGEMARQILPDGVYFEQSTWYQRYTLDIFSHFTILRSLDRDASLDLRSEEFEEGLGSAFHHFAHMTMPDGRTPLIGDDDGGRILPLTHAASDDFRGTMAVGAVLLANTGIKYIAARASEEVFWLMGPAGITSFDQLAHAEPKAGSKAFPDGGYFTMRDGWTDTDNMLIVDCGNVGSLSGGHGHADTLSINVAIHGKSVLVDPGTYTYHESREMRDDFRSTAAHNTLVVDDLSSSQPGSTFNWKSRAEAKNGKWITEDRFDYFEGSHDGYRRLSDPVTHKRSILFLKNDYWIVRDTAETTGRHKYSLNFHFAADIIPRIGNDASWIGNDEHRIFTFGDRGEWRQQEGWVSKEHGSKTSAPYMSFVSKGEGAQEFFSFIIPVDHGVEPPMVTETPAPHGRAFVIRYSGYLDLFVFNDQAGRPIKTGVFDTDFQYSWARLSDDRIPDEALVIGGKSLTMEGTELIHEPVDFASIRRLGTQLYIKTSKGRFTANI